MSDLLPTVFDTVTKDDLRWLTNAVVDRMQSLLRRCTDADITFVPRDPLASDPYAEPGHEQNMAWTLGHIIVHVTASAEDFAAMAAELARGVAYHGRSRREVPWQSVTTLAQCRARLEESRRMCLASLGMWPDHPDPTNTCEPWEGAVPMGAAACYGVGLRHEAGHLDQVRDVASQARIDRWRKSWLGRWRSRFGRGTGGEASGQQGQAKPVAAPVGVSGVE